MALVFAGIITGLTSAVHFVALTSGRQTDFAVLEWPSTLYAVELLAWDIFLGLSLLCAAVVFVGSGPGLCPMVSRYSRYTIAAWRIGPIVGDMALQRIGILSYGVGLPIAALTLSRFFHRNEDSWTQEKGQD